MVLLRTGWSARWGDRKRYFGDDTPGSAANLHFPSFGADAAKLLVDERKAGALGVDTPSHRLRSVDRFPGAPDRRRRERSRPREPEGSRRASPTGAWLVALPMKIAGGSGGPVRVIALVAP